MLVRVKSGFFKEDTNTQRNICTILKKLEEKLHNYDDVNKVFNDDSIVYDRINHEIFIYKSSGNIQYRFVYGYQYSQLYLIDYFSKKKNNKKYINELNAKYVNSKVGDFEYKKVE